MTGRLGFLERPWGGIEPFDYTLPHILRQRNVHTQMFTDHSQYQIAGGECYLHGFTTFDVTRGQEIDPWSLQPDQNGIRGDQRPANYKGTYAEHYTANQKKLQTEADYPSVQTLAKATAWLKENQAADNFMLWVETFDPHEPFEVPRHYIDLYHENYDGQDVYWPVYDHNIFTPEETEHLNIRYKAKLTMTDRHIGELLDIIDQYEMWQDTLVIFTTDHGYLLGEHDYTAKNFMPPYNEVFHIPLVICHPDFQPGRCSAITQNIDILPTLMAYFGVTEQVLHYPLHGRSLLPLLSRQAESIRDSAIYGYFGKSVGYTDGQYTYFRAAAREDNRPLYLYAGMPTLLRQQIGADSIDLSDYNRIEMGRFLPYTEYPVYRYPADIIHFNNPSQEFEKRSLHNRENLLFNIQDDYAQEQPILDGALENQVMARLKACMIAHDSPVEQFERLGL